MYDKMACEQFALQVFILLRKIVQHNSFSHSTLNDSMTESSRVETLKCISVLECIRKLPTSVKRIVIDVRKKSLS